MQKQWSNVSNWITERLVSNKNRVNADTVSGWWLSHPSEKYEFVSWNNDYSQYVEK
jgi:hypothetical protein